MLAAGNVCSLAREDETQVVVLYTEAHTSCPLVALIRDRMHTIMKHMRFKENSMLETDESQGRSAGWMENRTKWSKAVTR